MSTRIPTQEEIIDCLNREYHLYEPDIDVLNVIEETSPPEYLCYCNICKQTFPKKIIAIRKGTSCPICIGKVVMKGINDIATTAPWMLQYLMHKEDAYKYTRASGKQVTFRCPVCGHTRKLTPCSIYDIGYHCPVCSDGVSRPNRFARALFKQLPVQDLSFEYISTWTEGKFYDIYFKWNNKAYVVEMDGAQHFDSSKGFFGSYEDIKANDLYKESLAKKNHVKLIRIPCKDSFNIGEMRQRFLDSELQELILSGNVNWEKCLNETDTNYLHKVCGYYNDNNHPSVKMIAQTFDFSTSTIRNYLKYGTTLGICNYVPKASFKRPKPKKEDDYIFDVYNGDELLGTYDNPKACKEDLAKRGYVLDTIKIRNSLLYRVPHKKLLFIYRNYSPKDIYNDNPKMQRVCEYYNNHSDVTIKEIAKIFSVSKESVSRYLNLGTIAGVCNYRPFVHFGTEAFRDKMTSLNPLCFPISVYKEKVLIGNYPSMARAIKDMKKRFPELSFVEDTISRHLKINNEDSFYYKGFIFTKYVIE